MPRGVNATAEFV